MSQKHKKSLGALEHFYELPQTDTVGCRALYEASESQNQDELNINQEYNSFFDKKRYNNNYQESIYEQRKASG